MMQKKHLKSKRQIPDPNIIPNPFLNQASESQYVSDTTICSVA